MKLNVLNERNLTEAAGNNNCVDAYLERTKLNKKRKSNREDLRERRHGQ
jgi:hypothetical protein